jgi:hypothetical protein
MRVLSTNQVGFEVQWLSQDGWKNALEEDTGEATVFDTRRDAEVAKVIICQDTFVELRVYPALT